jgi:hypothetical protein
MKQIGVDPALRGEATDRFSECNGHAADHVICRLYDGCRPRSVAYS